MVSVFHWSTTALESMVEIHNEAPLWKPGSPFPRKYQLQIVSWLWVGLRANFHPPCWDFFLA